MEKNLWKEEEKRRIEILKRGNFVRAEVVVEQNGYTDPVVSLQINNVSASDMASLIIGLKQIEKSIYAKLPKVKKEIKKEIRKIKRNIKSISEYAKEEE